MRLFLGGEGGFVVFRGRDSPRRATYFLLLRQKKVSKEKATPLSATPSLRYGATCGARVSRGLAELASLKQLRALIRETLRSSAQPEGGETTRAIALLGHEAAAGAQRQRRWVLGIWDWLFGAERSEGVSVSTPSGCAGERSVSRIRARPCLSEASLGETPRNVSTAGCPERSAGTQPAGSPFLWLLSFGEAKESSSPAGASPGPGTQQSPPHHRGTASSFNRRRSRS